MAEASTSLSGYLRYLNPFDEEVRPWVATAGLVAVTSSAALYMIYKCQQDPAENNSGSEQQQQQQQQQLDVRPRLTKGSPLLQRMCDRVNSLDSVGDRPVCCKLCKPKYQNGGQIQLNLEHGGQVTIDPSLTQKSNTGMYGGGPEHGGTFMNLYNNGSL